MMKAMSFGGWAEDDADIIAIDEHSALCLAAHEAGSPLWQPLVDGVTFQKLVESMTALYAAAPERIESDIERLFSVFDERGLLNW